MPESHERPRFGSRPDKPLLVAAGRRASPPDTADRRACRCRCRIPRRLVLRRRDPGDLQVRTADRMPRSLPTEPTAYPAQIPKEAAESSRRCPASPQARRRKALLSRVIPPSRHPARERQDRPVTPEVADSSPVAPVHTFSLENHAVSCLIWLKGAVSAQQTGSTLSSARMQKIAAKRRVSEMVVSAGFRMLLAHEPAAHTDGLDLRRVRPGRRGDDDRSRPPH